MHLALVAELAAVVQHAVEAGLRADRLEGAELVVAGALGGVGLREQLVLGGEDVALVVDLALEHVVALDLHLGGEAEQVGHRRQEDRRGLAAPPGPDEPADGLREEQRGRGAGGVDPDGEPRHVDALGDHPDRDHPALLALGERRDPLRGGLLVRQHDGGLLAGDGGQQGGVRPGGVLVGGDHQRARVGHVPAHLGQPLVRGGEHRRHPGAGRVERRAQRLGGEVAWSAARRAGRRSRRRRGCATTSRRCRP